MNHTQGKLKVCEEIFDNDGIEEIVLGSASFERLSIAVVLKAGGNAQEANARRLVACWNACTAMLTKDIEELAEFGNGVMQLIVKATDAITDRDELLEALKKALDALKIANDIGDGPIHDTIWMPSGTETLFDYMGAAIKKAEGKE